MWAAARDINSDGTLDLTRKSNTVYHYRDGTWAEVSLPGAGVMTPSRIGRFFYGSSEHDVWLVADAQHLYHWDGTVMTSIEADQSKTQFPPPIPVSDGEASRWWRGAIYVLLRRPGPL